MTQLTSMIGGTLDGIANHHRGPCPPEHTQIIKLFTERIMMTLMDLCDSKFDKLELDIKPIM